jgi:hemerythrin superfamily protein
MNIIHKLKATAVAGLIVGCVSMAGTAEAQQKNPPKQQTTPQAAPQQQQQDISDADLKLFVDASTRLMELQQANEKVMLTILEEEKLSVETFNTLAQAHQQQKLAEAEATAEEKAAFNKAVQRMMEMQPDIEKNMQQAIQKDGMSMERYEQIMLAYQQNPTIQAKVQKMMGL